MTPDPHIEALAETVRASLDRSYVFDPHPSHHRHARAALRELLAILEARTQERDEARAVAGGVVWLDNNIHNYGSDAWRGYFKAVLRDARCALTEPKLTEGDS